MTMMRTGEQVDADQILEELVQLRAVLEGAIHAVADGDLPEVRLKLEGLNATSRVLLLELEA